MQYGKPCCWMDTRDVLVVTPTSSNQVDPDYAESERRLEEWFAHQRADIIIATGFIASTPQNIPTTLKRDGSDFSAAILGALIRARQVTIWTDVDGVFSADPRKGLTPSYICISFLLCLFCKYSELYKVLILLHISSLYFLNCWFLGKYAFFELFFILCSQHI